MQALLQSLGGGSGFPMPSDEPLAKLNAGRMEAAPIPSKPGKFMITPMVGKGVLQLVKDDQLTRFQWKDRISNVVDQEINHMIFPGDADFIKVNTGRAEDRVYMLQFTSNTSRRYFFWLQDKNDANDEEKVRKINEAMNNPQAVEAAGGDGDQAAMMQSLLAGLGGAGAGSGSDMMGGGAMSSTTTPASGPATTSTAPASSAPASGAGNRVQMADLASVLANLPPAPSGAEAADGGTGGAISGAALQSAMMGLAQAQASARQPVIPLQETILAEDVEATGILEDPAVQQELIALLPEGQRSPADLADNLHSPQFQQTLSSLTGALQTENFNSIFANFNLDAAAGADALARGNGVEAFLTAIEAQARAQSSDGAEEADGEAKTDASEPPASS